MNKVSNVYCGYTLNETQKARLIQFTLLEFKKPVGARVRPFKLVEKVKRYK